MTTRLERLGILLVREWIKITRQSNVGPSYEATVSEKGCDGEEDVITRQ